MGLDPRHLSIQFHPKRKLQKTSTQEAKLELTSCRTTSWRDQQTMTGRWKRALNNIDRTFQIKYQKHPKHASRYPKSLKSCESASFFGGIFVFLNPPALELWTKLRLLLNTCQNQTKSATTTNSSRKKTLIVFHQSYRLVNDRILTMVSYNPYITG